MNPGVKVLTLAQIERMAKLSAKHAEERTRLDGEQHNARLELLERQRKEAQEAMAADAPIVSPPAAAAPKRKK